MNNKAYEQYLKDENYRAAILAAARLERTKAIRSLIVEPLRSLLKSPPRPQTRMLRRSYC
jgi:hypothetical protein